MTVLNRQPAGTPVGGQFAAGTREETGTELAPGTAGATFFMLEPLTDGEPAGPFRGVLEASEHIDENGLDEQWWKIVPRTIEKRHTGTCYDCDGPVGLLNGEVVHLDREGVPDTGSHNHDAEFDPYTYDGNDVDAIAEASGWGGSTWEKYEDARAERNVAEAYEQGLAARPPTVAGVDLTGTADDVRTRAQKAMWDAQTVYEVAGAKATAEGILAEHPDATVLELEENYDDDGGPTTWSGGRILDANGKHIADFEDFEDDHWASVADLPTQPKIHVVHDAAGTVQRTTDPRYAFMAWDGNRRSGYSGKLDLKAAASVDLTGLIGGAQ